MKEKCGKTYTVNLNLTTCTIMVNGKNPENFGDRDIKEIHKLIENVNNVDKNKTITKLNEIMKSKLEKLYTEKEYNRNMQIKMKKSPFNVSNVPRIVEQKAHSEIELLEKEELEDYTCRICQDFNLKILQSPVKKGANRKTSYHHNDIPAITQELSSSRNVDSTEKSPETCNICDTIITEDKYEICDICNDIAHPECITISGNSLICHSCCNTIERLEPTQDENEQIDTSQTFVKSCELPENEENNPEQSQETVIIRTNSPNRQELQNNHEIANNNQQYAQEKKTNQRNGKKQHKGQTLIHSQLMNNQHQSVNNPSFESNQENSRAAMNIASTVNTSVPTNPEVIKNPFKNKLSNGVAQVNMNYPPRVESSSLKPGCNIMTSGYNVNEGHRGQVLGPGAINNNDIVRPTKPPMADQVAQPTEASNTTLQIVSFNCKSIKSCSATDKEIDANVNYAAKGVDKYDPLPPIYLPRGYGGVAIIWKMNLDSIIKTLDDGRERIQCVEVLGKDNNNLILISIYLPSTGSRDHYEESIEQLNEIVQ
ncbi:unnamed protein product [Mytilus edulis]|uniref:Uncharacterized protein n=1 Tax=Mytilus edulis TaxID=6550 RepID=A0A8S3RBY1_MYTED|nr:unnamed protein product [Mytilus edulis]